MDGPAELKNAADRITVVAFAAAYAAVAYFTAPLARFADPSDWATLGGLFAFAVALAFLAMWHSGEERPSAPVWKLATAVVGIAAVYEMQAVSRDAHGAAMANARRCRILQHDMLSGVPRRSDSRELFTALGCQPQGQEGVVAPRTAIPVDAVVEHAVELPPHSKPIAP